MRFTDIALIDPIMSLCVAVFVFAGAIRNLGEALDLFLEKAPHGIDVAELREHLLEIDGVEDVHHIHVWSLDGQSNCATMHIVTSADAFAVKEQVRVELSEHGITHSTLELENEGEQCDTAHCHIEAAKADGHHHHHHHHHH